MPPSPKPKQSQPSATPPDVTPPSALDAPPQPHTVDRPRLLTPEKQTQICDLLHLGLTRSEAAAFVGATPRTLANYERENSEFLARPDGRNQRGRN